MKLATFDIESNNWIDFVVCGFFDGQVYKTFTREKDFLEFIDKRAYSGFTFFSHNGGKFDMLFFIEEMYKRSWNVSLMERGGRIIRLEIDTPKGNQFVFADSYAILDDSLERLSEAFKVKHTKIKFDFSKHKVRTSDKRLMKHLENDCKGLHEILTTFYNQEFIHSEKITIASQAMNTFMNKFCEGELVSLSAKHEEIIREFYYAGGRVEVYKGRGDVNSYDVNSLYPYVMLNEMPTGECRHTARYIKGAIGFYHVKISSTPSWYVTPLLVKMKKNLFVNGKGDYFMSSALIEYLKSEFGVSVKIIDGYYFKGKEFLFNEYVEFFYKMKSENKDSFLYYMAKKFMNALYGKFTQRRENTLIERFNGQNNFCMLEQLEAQKYHLCSVIVKNNAKFILPYIGAYITELARLHHFKLMNQCQKDLYYCDTDSLFVSKNVKLPTGDNIGELSFKGTYKGVFINNKMYALQNKSEEKIVFKGFKVDAFTYDDFEQSLLTESALEETRERVLSYRECLNRVNGLKRVRGSFLKVVDTTKVTKPNVYDKRKTFESDNFVFDSKPFQFHEI